MKQFNTFVLDTTIYILDFLYRGRDFQRFWVLEVIARAPYFSFISVLHFRESLGLRGAEHIYLMKEHFYQALNETEHLEEMELREGINIGSIDSSLNTWFFFTIGLWLLIISLVP
ncbi:MAG: hypothetical protein CM15mV13_2680 [uncultured marine virus]|nr:MAG: hypothetical protein CM15mV13_2680 [uncultured marine virus]